MPREGDRIRWQVCGRCGGAHGDPERCADGLGFGPFNEPAHSLAAHLAWLETMGAKPCSCRFAWLPLRPRNIDPGFGWVRMHTDPRCAEHGADVRDARAGVPAAGVVALHPPMRKPCGCPLDAECNGYHAGALDGWPP